MHWRVFKISITLFSFCNAFAYSQSEEEMKVSADKYFSEAKYLEATPLYMRLLSLKPDDYNLNYRYGACLLFNSNKKQDAAKYLSYSIKNPLASPENHYFLGKALQYSYLFGDAVKEFNIYLQNRTKPEPDFPVERDIEMCQNGRRLLASVTDLIVLEKKEITSDKFFRIYDLKDIGGSLIVTTDFQTKLDKKNNHIPLIHFPQNPSVVYYSSFGDNGTQGKDIYFRKKRADGTWSDATLVEGKINTKFDEDFPYLDPSGDYLYFSSKGHNSMGGYDVFRSKIDPLTGAFGAPENLDFAISSPDDDVLFIVDSLNQNAYFASARQSELGKLHVYKVMMERVPLQMVVLKGTFVSEKNPESKLISIEISDATGNKIIGNFKSDENGNYTITLPKSGNYEYVMKVDGNGQEFRSQVKIPTADGFSSYKQVIKHLDENNLEVVKVINFFDETVENQQDLLAEVIRKRSALDVNVSEFDLNKIASLKADRAILNDIGLANLSLNEVIDVLEQQTLKNQQNNTLAATISNNVNNLVVENKAEFLRLEENIKEKVANAKNANSTDDKYRLFKEAENLIKVQNELKKYSDDLIRLSDSVSLVLSNGLSQEDQNQLQEVAKGYTDLYKEGKEQEALALLAFNKDVIQKTLNTTSGNIVQNLVDKSVQLDEMNAQTKSKMENFKEEIAALKIEIVQLDASLEDAKKKDIPAIENQIASKKNEIELIQEEILVLQKTIDARTIEKYAIDKQIDLLQDAISNKSLVTVTRNIANKAISETEKTNSNTLVSYVAQQVKSLEDADPSLKERIVVTNGLNADDLYAQYLTNAQGISDDTNLNKETKLFKQLTSDRTTIKYLDDRLSEINTLISQGKGNDVLENEKLAILSYKEKVQNVQNEREAEVANILAKQGVGDKETVIGNLKSDYLQNKTFIQNNSNLSTSEKNKALNKEDESLLLSVEAELKKVESSLVKTPNDQVLLIKQNSLNEIKASLERDILSRKEVSSEANQMVETNESPVQTLYPEYSNKIAAIESDNTISDINKNQLQNAIDLELIEKVDEELRIIDEQTYSNSNNAMLQERKQQLNAIKEEKEAAIQNRNLESLEETEKLISALPSYNLSVEKINIINQINPEYFEKVMTIQDKNTDVIQEKAKKQLNADVELLEGLKAEKINISKQLLKNPDSIDLNEKLKLIEDLEGDAIDRLMVNNKIVENKEEQIEASFDDVKDKRSVFLQELDEKIQQIKSNVNLSDLDKQEAVVNEKNESIRRVNEEIEKLTNKTNQDPTNPSFQKELTIYKLLKKELETELNLEQETLDTIREEVMAISQTNVSNGVEDINKNGETTTLTEHSIMVALMPNYQSEKSNLLNDSQLSQEDRDEALFTLEAAYNSKLKDEIASLKKRLEMFPDDKEFMDKLALLEAMEFASNNELSKIKSAQSSSEDSSLAYEDESALVNKVAPDYKVRKAALMDSKMEESKKINQLMNLEEGLLRDLSASLSELEQRIQNKPEDKLGIQEKEILLNAIRIHETELENYIALRNAQNKVSDKKNLIATLDESYNEEMNNLDLDDAIINLDQKINREQELQIKLLDKRNQNNAVLSVKNDTELLRENSLIDELIIESQARIANLIEMAITEEQQRALMPIVADLEYQDQQLIELKVREEEIENKLADGDLSKKEEKQLNAELEQVNEAKNIRINEILNVKIDDLNQSTEILKKQAQSSNRGISDDEMTLASNYEQSVREYKDLANKAKSVEEKNNLLKQAYNEQVEANDRLMNAVFDAKIKEVEEDLTTSIFNLNEKKVELEKLETQNRLVGVQIENLESEKSNLKKRDLALLNEEIQVKKTEQKVLVEKMEILEDEIKRIESQEIKSTLEKTSEEVAISFEEEIKLAQSKEYSNYFESGSKALTQENKVLTLESVIDSLRQDIKNEISTAVANGRAINNESVVEKSSALNLKVQELSQAKTELQAYQKDAKNKLPEDPNLALQMQNMTNRGVLPINVEQLAIASLNLPKSGIIIDTNSGSELKALQIIPLDLKTPSGLVYRVQVGAFSKPIPKDLFKEFAPVTTEKIPNSNITRYLAGYFSSSDKATEARDQIRGLGYADAFIIAYCDGVRITIAEAKRLEASGECLPKKEDELALEVTSNVVQQLGLDTAALIVDADTYDYNKAVGAAKAEAAEKHLGLFYTVQVGVFLHPVNAATVREMSPLMTERLNNGTIRYSVGMFHSVEEARPTKRLANEKGISDAFITAYYNGKRISVKEAENLLQKNGVGILEPLKPLDSEIVETINTEDTLNTIAELISYAEVNEVEVIKSNPKLYQIVTKKRFNEFPRDVLNRYNMKGQFYFDEKEGVVKSNVFKDKDEIPSVYYFKDDIDTLIYEDSSVIDLTHIRIYCEDKVPGDVMDWLNKINLRKEFFWKENGIEICIFDKDEKRLKVYEDVLNTFGLRFEYIVPEEIKQ